MMRRRLLSRVVAALILAASGIALPARSLLARGGEEAAGIAIVGAFVLFFIVFFGAIYVYFALAFSTIARKTHTPNTWMAWIPFP